MQHWWTDASRLTRFPPQPSPEGASEAPLLLPGGGLASANRYKSCSFRDAISFSARNLEIAPFVRESTGWRSNPPPPPPPPKVLRRRTGGKFPEGARVANERFSRPHSPPYLCPFFFSGDASQGKGPPKVSELSFPPLCKLFCPLTIGVPSSPVVGSGWM